MRASTPKAWVLRSPVAPERAQALAVQLGISHTFAALLANRGFCSSVEVQDFLEPNLDKLLDAFTMRDMDRAAARIWKAIDERESILVYGDYDVDGITATSWSTTGPCGIKVTGRVMPPQFHQPSRGRACLRFTTRTTSSFILPGLSPRAASVNGA